jgi:aspartate racemase
MKTLGLIGGTSWISTVDYYRYVNELTNEKLGGVNAAKLFLYSVNFDEFKKLVDANDWEQVADILSDVAGRLESAGADCIVLCANTTHLVADAVQERVKIPLLHIADATAKEIAKQNIKKVGLLGTKFTMERDFFIKRLLKYDIEAIIPESDERNFIHSSIFEELGKGIFTNETKSKYLEIIGNLQAKGADGVIFGCTEIPMLLKPEDCSVATFDTTFIHAKCAVDFALT